MRINILVLVATIVLVVMPAGVQAQSDEGLVAEWHFDEGDGSVVKDSSGNGNDGIIYGATWVDGKFGKGLSFDGVDDRVKLPYTVINGLVDVTSEFWIKTTDNEAGIITGANSNQNNEYLIFWNYGTETRPHSKPHIKGKYHHITPINTITDDNWHHFASVRSGSEISVYVDGKFQGVWTNAPTGNLIIDQNGLWIGGEQDLVGGGWDKSEQFDGILDEVRIYKHALSAEEIKELHEQGPMALSLIKTASPNPIKQGQTTTITLTAKNTGSTDIYDIEISDTIPSDLIFIEGEYSKIYEFLKPKDTRQFQYVIQFDEAGTFNFEPATATYADEKGNYKTVKSKPETLEVIPSIVNRTFRR